MDDKKYLYHYYEKNQPPFRTLTTLPVDEAKAVMSVGQTDVAWIDNFLTLRYERDKTLRDMFISIGGNPVRTAPVYFTLGANEGLKTWFKEPAWIKIAVDEFDRDTVSFTYGDSFAVLNASLDTGEEWWGKVLYYDDVVKLIDKYGFPEDPPYHMAKRIFPKDKHINHYLKYIEAHVWSDAVFDKIYR